MNLILSKEEILERVWDNIGRMEERFYTDDYTEEDVQEMNLWQNLLRIVNAYEEEEEYQYVLNYEEDHQHILNNIKKHLKKSKGFAFMKKRIIKEIPGGIECDGRLCEAFEPTDTIHINLIIKEKEEEIK